jgi:two-component system, NtrC family, response regulator AtoC
MAKVKNILVVDDEQFIRLNLKQILTKEKYNVFVNATGGEALETVKKEQIDVALLDLNLPDISGLEVLKQFKQIQPDLLVIIITGFASVESAVDAIKLGAYDYIKKPFKADALKLITRLAFETLNLKNTVKRLKEQQGYNNVDTIIGDSEKMQQVKHQINEFAKYDSETVLITGESGCGKELVAKAIHNLSPRSERDFIEINCASIPDNLLESELFGYEKGAFTDAKQSKAGLFEKADGGTLFLDEIGEMSLSLQAKLLRVIENKKFRRLGSTKDIEVNVRIVAATNKNMNEAIANKEFREDLYYRLNVLRVEIPPLRERGKDVIILAENFLNAFNKKFNKNINRFSDETKEILLSYNWPGNIRELKNIIERICILQNEPEILPSHLPAEWINNKFYYKMAESFDEFGSNGRPYDEILSQMEIAIIKKAFLVSGQNTAKAARLLNIPRETLRYKLSKFNIGTGDN